MQVFQTIVNTMPSVLCRAGAVLLLLSAGALLKPALAQTYGPTDCDPANPFDDYNQPDCCPPYDISCNPYDGPFPDDPGPGDGGGSTPSDPPPPPQPSPACVAWDEERSEAQCYNDPGPGGFNFNQPLSPDADGFEQLALAEMKDFLPSVAVTNAIFSAHTSCYAGIGTSKKTCDDAFETALGNACYSLLPINMTLAQALTILQEGVAHSILRAVSCFSRAKYLTVTMSTSRTGRILDTIAGLDILSSVTLGVSQDLRNAVNWHKTKIQGIKASQKCERIWNEGRAMQCVN